MAFQQISYAAYVNPDLDCLKFQLGSMRGIIEMDIHTDSNSVTVDYEDTLVNEKQISRCLYDLGYHLQS